MFTLFVLAMPSACDIQIEIACSLLSLLPPQIRGEVARAPVEEKLQQKNALSENSGKFCGGAGERIM